jgi:hypothetical protein
MMSVIEICTLPLPRYHAAELLSECPKERPGWIMSRIRCFYRTFSQAIRWTDDCAVPKLSPLGIRLLSCGPRQASARLGQ